MIVGDIHGINAEHDSHNLHGNCDRHDTQQLITAIHETIHNIANATDVITKNKEHDYLNILNLMLFTPALPVLPVSPALPALPANKAT